MTNMSYCRFRNTVRDLEDCKDQLEIMTQEGQWEPLNDLEETAAADLVKVCIDLIYVVSESWAIELPDFFEMTHEQLRKHIADLNDPPDCEYDPRAKGRVDDKERT